MSDETTKRQTDEAGGGEAVEMVEFPIGVKIDPKEPKTVVLTFGKDEGRIVFDTEMDARRADGICTTLTRLITAVFTVGNGVLKEGPKVWKPGEPEPEESRYCGDCALFGGDCDAGDVDGNEDQMACGRFVKASTAAGRQDTDGGAA